MNPHKKLNAEFPGLGAPNRDCLRIKLQEIANRNGAALVKERGKWILWIPGHEDRVTKTLSQMETIIQRLTDQRIFF